MMRSMTRKPGGVAAKRAEKRELTVAKIVDKPSRAPDEFTAVQMAAIQMIARGEIMPDIARRLQYHLAPHEKDRKKRLKKARSKLRLWFTTQKFRDAIWQETVLGLELDHPKHLRGISKKAAAGRVDATKLALEITGRHAPQAEVTPATINIQFGDIPRPGSNGHMPAEVDPDEVVEDAEWEED